MPRSPGRPVRASINLFLAIAFTTGCDDGLLDSLPDTQAIAACLVAGGTATLPAPGGIEPIAVDASGTVQSSGAGTPPEDCFNPSVGVGWGAATGQVGWFNLANGTDEWLVAIALPGIDPPDAGAEVSIRFRHRFGGFGPTVASLLVTDATGELAWLGLGGDTGDLLLPSSLESVERGMAVFRDRDSCGTWEAYELEVSTAADGVVTLPYGERVDTQDASLYHGGYRHDLGGKTNCADWFVADLSVAWRRQ